MASTKGKGILIRLSNQFSNQLNLSFYMSQKSISSKQAPSVESLNWNDKGHGEMIEVINIHVFKKLPCTATQDHNKKHCIFYHSENDRIRNSSMYPQLCPNITKNNSCQHQDLCLYCHNTYELLYHQANFKKLYCPSRKNNLCSNANMCMHAHHEKEIQTTLIHHYQYDFDFFLFEFKTVWCPFILENHNFEKCVYAHSFQDIRRKPNIIDYRLEQCAEFNKKHNQCLKSKLDCKFSHNQFEVSYNPFFYKLHPCPLMIECKRFQYFCPYYHSEQDKRTILPNILNGTTSFTCKNRILQNTFNKKKIKERRQMKIRSADHIMVNAVKYKESNFKKQYMKSQEGSSPSSGENTIKAHQAHFDEEDTIKTIINSIFDD